MAIIQVDDKYLKDIIIEVCEEIGLGLAAPNLIAEAVVYKIRLDEEEQDKRTNFN